MSTYKGIFGKTIKHLSSDPDNSTYEGQIWYNTTEGKFKTVVAAAAWASAASLINNHGEHIGGSGSGTDGLAFGGEGPTNYNLTEEWNGTGFAAGGNYPFAGESIMGCGDSGPSSIAFGGINNASPGVRQSVSATYDGSSWTATNSLPTAKRAGQGFGTNTAAVAAGGDTSPSDPQTSVEEWDGTNWTAVNAMPAGKGNMGGGTGSQTAGLVFGGGRPSPSAPSTTDTYSYDGTNWTTVANMNTGRNQTNGWGGPAGQTASVCGGGNVSGTVSAATENWDGTAWSTSPATLAAARQGSANGIGTSSSNGIQAGGYTTSYVSTVEEYNFTANTITAAAWTSSTNYPTPNSYLAGFGTTTAGVTTGGDGPPGNGITTTGEYDGSSWTTGGALGTGRRGLGAGTNSSETAGLVFGGADPGVPAQYANVEEYNGSTWSEVTNLPGNQANVGGFGTQTAGACLPNSATATLEYDGTNWTSGGSLSNPRSATLGIGCGTQTAGLAVGGSPASPLAGDTEEYDGTSWTAGGDYPRAIQFQGSSGIQTSALISGGGPGSNTDSGTYDGTAFSTAPSMSTGREAHAGVGSAGSPSGLAVTGRTAPRTNAVEELTPETTSINIESVDNS